jgi:hypothetical protein
MLFLLISHFYSTIEHTLSLLLFWQQQCTSCANPIVVEAAAVSHNSNNKENGTRFEVILCPLYSLKKHFNIVSVLSIGFQILLLKLCYL